MLLTLIRLLRCGDGPGTEDAFYYSAGKGQMDEKRILELAVEALENHKEEVELEIEAIRSILNAATTAHKSETATLVARKRRPRTAEEKKAQSRRMKKIWAKRKAAAAA
ncbi:MAG: hypothetical protein ABSH28_25480 [Acidobacteriota bacterium]|jgi:hypothetical protein